MSFIIKLGFAPCNIVVDPIIIKPPAHVQASAVLKEKYPIKAAIIVE